MADASGRYNSQFHFGNGFWLGSSTLCKELNNTSDDNLSGISGIDVPPYQVRFHVVRMGLNLPSDIEPSVSEIQFN